LGWNFAPSKTKKRMPKFRGKEGQGQINIAEGPQLSPNAEREVYQERGIRDARERQTKTVQHMPKRRALTRINPKKGEKKGGGVAGKTPPSRGNLKEGL